jgi:membrane-associated protein
MEYLHQFVDIFLHLDLHLADWAAQLGPSLYLLLFAVVFCETGLVVTPFLPGDSLLFATGALVALSQSGGGYPLSLGLMLIILVVAAVLGDAVNYWVGAKLGGKLLDWSSRGSRLIRRSHIERTHDFYERYGGKTIVFARFVPIVRTFAPFVAGIGKMSYRRFFAFNVFGGIVWVLGFVLAGYWFGNLPSVKRNFQWVILAIIVLSILPAVIELWRSRHDGRASTTG